MPIERRRACRRSWNALDTAQSGWLATLEKRQRAGIQIYFRRGGCWIDAERMRDVSQDTACSSHSSSQASRGSSFQHAPGPASQPTKSISSRMAPTQIFPPSSFHRRKYSFPSTADRVSVCAKLPLTGSMRAATKGVNYMHTKSAHQHFLPQTSPPRQTRPIER